MAADVIDITDVNILCVLVYLLHCSSSPYYAQISLTIAFEPID